MMDVEEVKRWLATLEDGNNVAIDDSGLALVELSPLGTATGAYLEIGGTPSDER